MDADNKEAWHDALAFARAIINNDLLGAAVFWENNKKDPMRLLIPLSLMVGALANRLSIDSGLPLDVVYAKVAETIDKHGDKNED